MVTTRSQDKSSPPPDAGNAVAGSKRDERPEPEEAPPAKHQKHEDKKAKVEDAEAVKEYVQTHVQEKLQRSPQQS